MVNLIYLKFAAKLPNVAVHAFVASCEPDIQAALGQIDEDEDEHEDDQDEPDDAQMTLVQQHVAVCRAVLLQMITMKPAEAGVLSVDYISHHPDQCFRILQSIAQQYDQHHAAVKNQKISTMIAKRRFKLFPEPGFHRRFVALDANNIGWLTDQVRGNRSEGSAPTFMTALKLIWQAIDFSTLGFPA